MSRTILLAAAASLLFASAAPAAAPPFDTPAKYAYLIDLSSGAVLYAKNADGACRRLDGEDDDRRGRVRADRQGPAALEQDVHGAARDMAEVARPAAGSTMFLSRTSRSASRICSTASSHLSGNDASVVLAECIAGTEQAFAQQMNTLAKKIGLTNSHFGNRQGWPDKGCTYVTARDLATLARSEIEQHPKLYKEFIRSRASPGARRWARARTSPRPTATRSSASRRRRRAQDRPHRRGGLRLHRLGRAERAPADRGLAGLPSWNARVQESTRLIQWGFNAWQAKPLFKSGEKVGTRRSSSAARSEVPLVAPRTSP